MQKTYKLTCLEDKVLYIDQDENVAEIAQLRQDEKYKYSSYPTMLLCFTLFFDLALMLFFKIKQNQNMLVMSIFFSVFLSPNLFNFIYKVIMYHIGSSNWRTSSRMHAALHMVINAVNKRQCIPTLEEVKKSSKFLDGCKSFLKMRSLVLFALLFVLNLVFPTNSVLLKSAISVVLGIIIGLWWYRFSWLESLILLKPTDEELKIVLYALSKCDKIAKTAPIHNEVAG